MHTYNGVNASGKSGRVKIKWSGHKETSYKLKIYCEVNIAEHRTKPRLV